MTGPAGVDAGTGVGADAGAGVGVGVGDGVRHLLSCLPARPPLPLEPNGARGRGVARPLVRT